MERVYVESKAIKWVLYHATNRRLEIGFHDGRIGEYFDVPEKVSEELITADSIGKYFSANVRNVYRYSQIIGPYEKLKAKPGRKKSERPPLEQRGG